MDFKYKATLSRDLTKTGQDYFWLIPNEINDMIPLILEHYDTGFSNTLMFTESLRPYYNEQILDKADVPV